jgi:hypothetical protein
VAVDGGGDRQRVADGQQQQQQRTMRMTMTDDGSGGGSARRRQWMATEKCGGERGQSTAADQMMSTCDGERYGYGDRELLMVAWLAHRNHSISHFLQPKKNSLEGILSQTDNTPDQGTQFSIVP